MFEKILLIKFYFGKSQNYQIPPKTSRNYVYEQHFFKGVLTKFHIGPPALVVLELKV